MVDILKMVILMTYLLKIKKLFTELPIYGITNNIRERLKVILTKRSFDNIMNGNNTQNSDFGYLPFDCDERLITIQWIYRINDDVLFMFNNGSSVDV